MSITDSSICSPNRLKTLRFIADSELESERCAPPHEEDVVASEKGSDPGRKLGGRDSVQKSSYGSSNCAICTALSAAPLRIWSATTQNAKPFSTESSRRMRPT